MPNIYDQLAKQLAVEGFGRAGRVETEVEVQCDVGRIDVTFSPEPFGDGTAAKSLAGLGMFGRLAARAMVLEAFHQAPSSDEVVSCILKHQHHRIPIRRKSELATLPTQWIISAGRPNKAIAELSFQPDRAMGPGVYRAPKALDTRLIVTNELPRTQHTLIVRIYGAGRTLKLATKELVALPRDSPEVVLALPIMVRLRLHIPPNPDEQTPEDKEFLMDTYWTMESVIADVEKIGEQRGLQRGQQALSSLFRKHFTRRFGPLPADLASVLDEPHDLDELEHWAEIAPTASREEILAALRAAK